ncbi:hypothetical protein DIPPA_29157 [Diplonema papillatum]|nr:hypothetical protein DIPPA_29157 [Diplonema papillatum]
MRKMTQNRQAEENTYHTMTTLVYCSSRMSSMEATYSTWSVRGNGLNSKIRS